MFDPSGDDHTQASPLKTIPLHEEGVLGVLEGPCGRLAQARAAALGKNDLVGFFEALAEVLDEVDDTLAILDKLFEERTGRQAFEFLEQVSRARHEERDAGPDDDLKDEAARVVKRLLKAGISRQEIARLLGISPERVRRKRRLTDKAAEVLKLHYAGLTLLEIEANVDVSRQGVLKILRAHGYEPNKRQPKVSPEQERQVLALHREGLSQTEIGRKLDLSRHDVKNTLYKHRHRQAVSA